MEYKKFAIGVLVILLFAGVTGVSSSAPEGYSAPSILLARPGKIPDIARTNTQDVRELAPLAPTWQQVNADGFGDPDASEVSALAVFSSSLYAGTSNPTDGALILRSGDGLTWTPVIQPGFGIAHDTRPPAILDMMVFNGRLYAGTGRGDGPGQIWRTVNGVNWAPMTSTGFSNPDTVDITPFAEYGGWIYTGAANLVSGLQIWRSLSGDNNTWTKVSPAMPGTNASITGLAEFGGELYAAVDTGSPAQIWCSDGGAWSNVINNGFGDSLTNATGGMAEFAGYLYVGAGNVNDGAQLWRTSNGTSWAQAIEPGFGDPNNQKVELVFVFQNLLYAGVKNTQTGMELWRSTDGATWEQANPDGFGDVDNTGSNGGNAVAEFLGDLYVGTSNVVDGGELWRLQEQQPPPPSPSPSPSPSPPPPTPAHHYLPFILGWP